MCDVHCVIIVLLPVLLQFTKDIMSLTGHSLGTATITSRTKRLRVMNLDIAKIRVAVFPVDKIIWNPLQRILRYSTVVTNE